MIFDNLLTFVGIYGILAISLNLTVGRSGQFNLGHIAFYAIGAYASTLMIKNLGYPWLLALLLAALLCSAAGYLIGLLTLKLSGDYFAVSTMGLAFIIKISILNLKEITRGPFGITGIARPNLFGYQITDNWIQAGLTLLFLLLAWLILGRLENSPWGRLVRAVRDDEIASRTLGKRSLQVKAQAVAISAFFAGIAGVLYAAHVRYIHPGYFNFDMMIFILVAIIFGGLGNRWGAVLGITLLTTFQQWLGVQEIEPSLAGPLQQIIYALVLMAMMMLRPKGLLPESVLRTMGGDRRAAS